MPDSQMRVKKMKTILRALSATIVFLVGCSESRWEMVSRRDIPAPGGNHIATIFEMSSFNTTGNFPQLSIRRAGTKLGKIGNVLQAAQDEVIEASWTSPTELVVKYQGRSEHPSTVQVDGVRITFVD
jgi:hypothetical protein